jgi:inward rectifier potassium channel
MAHRKIRGDLAARLRAIFAAPRRKPPRSQKRILPGGRRIVADGLEQGLWTDFYHNAMTASWPAFFGALAAAFVAINLVFAFVYAAGDEPVANARPGSLSDLFFFSVETTSTVGYGDMHPQTLYAHIVATSENFIGLVMLAVMTGLVFARFSRPRARLVFSKHPVIAEHDGVPTLIFRLANARNTFISEAAAKLWMLSATNNQEGRRFVSFQPLRLLRSENPVLALSWTLFHPIDADSPLHGVSESELLASETNFVVSIRGHDETSAQTVHARYTFAAQDLRPGHEFVDIHSLDENGMRHIDYAKIDDTRPVRPRPSSPS